MIDVLKRLLTTLYNFFTIELIFPILSWFRSNTYRSLMLLILIVFFICFYYFRKLSNNSHFLKKYSSYTSYFFITLGTFLTILVFGLFSNDSGNVNIVAKPPGLSNKTTLLQKFKWSLTNAMDYYKNLNIIYLILFIALLVLWLLIGYSELSYITAIISMVVTFIAFFVLLYNIYTHDVMAGGAVPWSPAALAANRSKIFAKRAAKNAVAANNAAKIALDAVSAAAANTRSGDATPGQLRHAVVHRERLRIVANDAIAAATTANAVSKTAGVNYVTTANEAARVAAAYAKNAVVLARNANINAEESNTTASQAHANATRLQLVADRPGATAPEIQLAKTAQDNATSLDDAAVISNRESDTAATVAVNANTDASKTADEVVSAAATAAANEDINDTAANANKKKPIWIRAAKFLFEALKSFYNTIKSFKATHTYIKILLLVEILCISLYFIIPIAKKYIYTNAVTKKVGILDTQADMGDDMAIIENEKELVSLLGGLSLDWNNILSAGLYKKSKEGELTQNLEKQGFLPKQGKQNTLLSKIVGIPINIETAITYIQANSPVIINLKNKIAHQKAIKLEKGEKKKGSNNIIKTKILLEKPIYTDKKKIIATYEDIGDSLGSFNYNYSISAWFFIHNLSPSERIANTKFTSLLNYGGRPNLLFNVEKNTLKITIKNSLDKELTVFETDKIRLQRWNNIITNINGGKLDIFINGKLVSSTTNPVPFMSYDTISTGEDDGISGGICNVTYYPTPLTLPEIKILYKSLKWGNPPIV